MSDETRSDALVLYGANGDLAKKMVLLRVVAPALESRVRVHSYVPGTWGPDEADRILDGGRRYDPTGGA